MALASGVYEVRQNVEVLELVESQIKQIELEMSHGNLKPVRLMQSIPGIGFIMALSMYTEICNIKRFSTLEKLAHYRGSRPPFDAERGTSKAGERNKSEPLAQVALHRGCMVSHKLVPQWHACESLRERV